MKLHSVLVILSIAIARISCQNATNLTFPDGFWIGTATSAYQIEGGWNASDKGESVWDRKCHDFPEVIIDATNGDEACDSYNRWEEDVAAIKKLGLDHYRFSLSWTRILPNGYSNYVSSDGILYYKNLLAALIENGIEPIVTLHHQDVPFILQEYGGWNNVLMVEWFTNYARVVFEELGPYVKYFLTINQPAELCLTGESTNEHFWSIAKYACLHNILKAHASVYHLYYDEFRATQQGQIAITTANRAFFPLTSSDEDAAETAFQFNVGWVMHPIYIGDYPEVMKIRVANVSASQGFTKSRLPEFTAEEIASIKGTNDFYAVNYYTSTNVATDDTEDPDNGVYNSDSGIVESTNETWAVSSTMDILYNVPEGFGVVLRKIRDEYGNPPVLITENGWGDAGETNDYARIQYFYDHLKQVLQAVNEDGCNVIGYTIWSLMDNFEWYYGYTVSFGMLSVDFDSPNKTRSEKLSYSWWQTILETRQLQDVPEEITEEESSSSGARMQLSWLLSILIVPFLGSRLMK